MFQVNNLVRTTELKKTFWKSDTAEWSNKLFNNTEVIKDTIPSYHIDNLQKRYNEALLEKTVLTLKENKDVRKALILN